MKFADLKIALVGPLPPPAGGMANQTRQLGELLRGEGAEVEVVQVNAPCLRVLPEGRTATSWPSTRPHVP